jgi:hypothetical protein
LTAGTRLWTRGATDAFGLFGSRDTTGVFGVFGARGTIRVFGVFGVITGRVIGHRIIGFRTDLTRSVFAVVTGFVVEPGVTLTIGVGFIGIVEAT